MQYHQNSYITLYVFVTLCCNICILSSSISLDDVMKGIVYTEIITINC